jgi:ribosomal protein L7/L12
MTQEEKRSICLILRQETGCGLMEASELIDKLIEALKNRPLTIMDNPSYLKITWEN